MVHCFPAAVVGIRFKVRELRHESLKKKKISDEEEEIVEGVKEKSGNWCSFCSSFLGMSGSGKYTRDLERFSVFEVIGTKASKMVHCFPVAVTGLRCFTFKE